MKSPGRLDRPISPQNRSDGQGPAVSAPAHPQPDSGGGRPGRLLRRLQVPGGLRPQADQEGGEGGVQDGAGEDLHQQDRQAVRAGHGPPL